MVIGIFRFAVALPAFPLNTTVYVPAAMFDGVIRVTGAPPPGIARGRGVEVVIPEGN